MSEAERLCRWHISELEGLLARYEDKDPRKALIEDRLIEAYEALESSLDLC